MGRIFIPDEFGGPPATFGDDSYPDNPNLGHVTVYAQFAGDADLTWHFDLMLRLKKTEVRYRHFRQARNDLSADLVRRVLRGVWQATIAIADDRPHRAKATRLLEEITRKPLRTLDPIVRARLTDIAERHVNDLVLLSSPLLRLTQIIGETLDPPEPPIREYVKALKHARNIRIFACRTVGTFIELLDPQHRQKALELVRRTQRYASADELEAELLHKAQIPARIFDLGNEKVTNVIRHLRHAVHDYLEDVHYLVVPEGAGVIDERDSSLAGEVGASDIAAGCARDLYESSDGRAKVIDAFRLVVLNGHVLRP